MWKIGYQYRYVRNETTRGGIPKCLHSNKSDKYEIGQNISSTDSHMHAQRWYYLNFQFIS